MKFFVGTVVAKVEWHAGELFPRIGFIVTNLRWKSSNVVRFYNKRGTAEQWIKEGKYALKWTRLSCHDFVDNQVRLQLFALRQLCSLLLSIVRFVPGFVEANKVLHCSYCEPQLTFQCISDFSIK